MNTPWGKSDSKINIERGVSWVGTPSHGGLAISNRAAILSLSMKARTYGTDRQDVESAPYFFFEEDCAYAIAFYEHPEWKRALELQEMEDVHTLRGVPPYDGMYEKLQKSIARTNEEVKAEMAEVIRRWYPEYFGQEAQ